MMKCMLCGSRKNIIGVLNLNSEKEFKPKFKWVVRCEKCNLSYDINGTLWDTIKYFKKG